MENEKNYAEFCYWATEFLHIGSIGGRWVVLDSLLKSHAKACPKASKLAFMNMLEAWCAEKNLEINSPKALEEIARLHIVKDGRAFKKIGKGDSAALQEYIYISQKQAENGQEP